MVHLVTALVAMAAGMYETAAAPSHPGVALRYDPPLGQTARYRVSLDVSGSQTSLGERLPVRWKAEGELWEEVVARGGDGSFWLRVTVETMTVTEANGAFANSLGGGWPEVRLHISATGAVIEAKPAAGRGRPSSPPRAGRAPPQGDGTGARERAIGSLMAELAPLILPDDPVARGDTWTADTAGGGRQTNRLLSVEGSGDSQVARIASSSRSPLALDEGIAELGLATQLSGEARQTSELELLVSGGLVLRHKGSTHLMTKSQVTLSLPEGEERFPMESDLTIVFDLRLRTVDGKSVSAP
jgi:hypothetical protein